jgi:phage shock protein A
MTDNVEELKNEIIVLRQRIAELERENSELHERENANILANAMRERIHGCAD